MRTRFLILFLLSVSAPLHAGGCTSTQAKAADNASGSWRSWPSIFAAYQRYGQCDDGAVGEGFSDSIVHLLASNWGKLNQAQPLIARQPAFQAFIIRHIDASADSDELQNVQRYATHSCPPSATGLCRQIAGAAKNAIAEAGR
ncbi:hypothetical protein B0E48_16795 [Rhodanobacter sp. C03]|nr:hypothetical protein B0E48_16795 [Rhodanobacter sp. C03]